MKKFLISGFLFGVLIFLLSFFIGLITLSDDYIIHKTAATSFEKIAWNLNLINHHPEKIKESSVFLGSSLMFAALSDSILTTNGAAAINFGINGTGHEVVLFFLERILKHRPAKVYLQLYKNDKSGLHSMTPLLYTPVSLLQSGQSFSLDFIKFIFKRVYFVMDYALWKLNGSKIQTGHYATYGCRYRDDIVLTPKAYREIKKETTDAYFESFTLHKQGFIKKTEIGKETFYLKVLRRVRAFLYAYWSSEFIFNCKSQSRFATACQRLCQKNNVEPYRLYIPMVSDAKIGKDFDDSFYVPRNGDRKIISLKNFTFLDSVVYWADLAHLSRPGALVFTQRLSGEIVSER